MQNFKKPKNILVLYSSFIAASSAIVLWSMLSSPSEAERAFLLGLSIPRLVIALGLSLAFILFVVIAIKAFNNQIWAEQFIDKWFKEKGRSRVTGWLSGISFGLGWIGSFLPEYRMGPLVNYWIRIQPVMIFLLFASLATLIVFFLVHLKNWNPAIFKLGVPLFAVCLLGLAILFYSGFAVVSTDDFWNSAGVPILFGQLIIVIIAGALFAYFGSGWKSRNADIFICIFIYIITASLWAGTPLHESFLMRGPYPPNYAFYPFADAAAFDAASQFSLIGQNFFILNSVFFERPLYLGFLAYLHSVAGQDYQLLTAVQAAIFAILPVIIYLIGRSLDIRLVGFTSALIVLLRGLNSIAASNIIDTAGPKTILTDFPTAIGIALITWLVCEWLQEPERKKHYPLWIGGAVGFTLMLRTNALILLVFIPLFALFWFSAKWKQWLLSSFFILVGLVSITLPWEIRNLWLGGTMYEPIVTKFQNVIKTRYQFPSEPDSSIPQKLWPGWITLKNTQAVIAASQGNPAGNDNLPCDSVICFSMNHFLHNIVTSILVLPTSPMLDDLRHLIRERNPYWQTDWDGNLTATAAFFLSLNLFFITLGISLAWREKQLLGLTPLAIFAAYNLSNGLARTSGGRYLVPTDWILIFYYLLGIFHVIAWVANSLGKSWNVFGTNTEPETRNSKSSLSKAMGAFIVLFLFGSLIPLSEHLHPPRFQNINPVETLANKGLLIERAGLTPHDLDTFLQYPDAKILVGRVLYPRSYKANQGEFVNAFYPYQNLGFPRTAFKLVGPVGESSIVLPGSVPANLAHASDVLVLGCKMQNYVDALVVIELGENGTAYARQPEAPLECPLQQPVCNNNSVCQ
jgi:hypothetical protein